MRDKILHQVLCALATLIGGWLFAEQYGYTPKVIGSGVVVGFGSYVIFYFVQPLMEECSARTKLKFIKWVTLICTMQVAGYIACMVHNTAINCFTWSIVAGAFWSMLYMLYRANKTFHAVDNLQG